MSAYLWIMTAGSAAIFALYGLRCAMAERLPELRKNAWPNALLSFVLAATFGTILARVGYALLMSELDFEYDGIEALGLLLEFEIDCVSFFCGAIGVCLGVLLANRLTRKGSAFVGMDAFAPFGALLAALFRLGELFFGSYGAGGELPEGSPLAFFPFALRIPVAGSRRKPAGFLPLCPENSRGREFRLLGVGDLRAFRLFRPDLGWNRFLQAAQPGPHRPFLHADAVLPCPAADSLRKHAETGNVLAVYPRGRAAVRDCARGGHALLDSEIRQDPSLPAALDPLRDPAALHRTTGCHRVCH